MGDEAQKRNTDCVYFLASPLTCKKGTDCEYRHSEAARVNPRDCWFWISGNCLNANCSFRHPPLDGRPGASLTTAAPQAVGGSSAGATVISSAPNIPAGSGGVSVPSTASKPAVPCFFFSQGYCAKGGKCPFSHGPVTQYRKESLTYQRPQVNESPANGEGNGVPQAKQQLQERKPSAQVVRPPVRTSYDSHEAVLPSNVYKLSTCAVSASSFPQHPAPLGERTDQAAKVGRSKPASMADETARNVEMMENMVPKAQVSNHYMGQISSGEKGTFKAHLDSSRPTVKQSQQSSTSYSARQNEKRINLEMQDQVFEAKAPHHTRELRTLHAGDLRNHLKRKKSDAAHGQDFSKDKPGAGRLASRAVPVTEVKDFTPKNSKKSKQEEGSDFSGPKTLAQIKAEKAKNAIQGNVKVKALLDDCRGLDMNPKGRNAVLVSASDFHSNQPSEPCKESMNDHCGMLDESVEPDKKVVTYSVTSCPPDISPELNIGIGMKNSNGILGDPTVMKFSKESNMSRNHSSESAIMKERNSIGDEGNLRGDSCSYNAGLEIHMDTGYVSADEFVEDGSEAMDNTAGVEYVSDEEEDDFAKKLGSFLS